MLLTSELVTNAFLHTHTETYLTVHLLTDRVRVEVVDGEERLPAIRDTSADGTSGRGLTLVDALSSRWGVDLLDRGSKRVWCEVVR